MKHINLPLSDDLHKRLKLYCVENDVPMTDVVRKLVEDFLGKEKKKSK